MEDDLSCRRTDQHRCFLLQTPYDKVRSIFERRVGKRRVRLKRDADFVPCSRVFLPDMADLQMPNTMNGESLRDEAHLRLLRLLEENPRMAQRDLAKALGVSVGKTNYCLKALLGKGLVKVGNFRRSDNKLAYAYVLTPAGMAAKASLTIQFLARKTVEYERLRHEIKILQADVDAANTLKEREAMRESTRLNTPASKMATDAERKKS